jgi:cytochrome c-type biogenesis protein CcmH/NrfG
MLDFIMNASGWTNRCPKNPGAAHYEFLARAYLDLKRYKEAAAACERAEELRIAELK